MFLSLTDCDNGQAVEIWATQVAAIQILDRTNTLVVLKSGKEISVRESAARVKTAVEMARGVHVEGPGRATRYDRKEG